MNNITIVGNAGKPIELKYTPGGMASGSFSVATTSGKDEKKVTVWHNVTVFGQMAEHAAASIEKGSRVIVVGKLDISSYENKEGVKVWTTKILADEVGLTMRFNAVFADKTEKNLAIVKEKFGAIPFMSDEEPF
jgi:single-strand DNA-binding protein